jgi:hypothetical protein
MPHAYEEMRDRFMKDGLSRQEAEEKAAKIYNAGRTPGMTPVGPGEAMDSSGLSTPRLDEKGPTRQGW